MRPVDVDGHVLHQVGLPYHWGLRGLTSGGSANDLTHMALDPNTHIQEKVSTCDIRAGRRPSGDDLRRELDELAGKGRAASAEGARARAEHEVSDFATLAHLGYGDEENERVGFFTDTSICIGCKACEVACKEWNLVPDDGLLFTGESYDHTSALGANTWRHVAFVEQRVPARGDGGDGLRWLMSSDVCKHCTDAACLDVCPTGALFRTESGTVVVQEDVCNGCGDCVPACPFGVLDQRKERVEPPQRADLPRPFGEKEDGRVWKCTLCYDRLKDGHEPACAKACPTDSIQFGPLDELRERAGKRLAKLEAEGWNGAQLYGHDERDGVGGMGAFFLLLDDPEVYGLPPDPVVTTKHVPGMWAAAVAAMAVVAAGMAVLFGGGR